MPQSAEARIFFLLRAALTTVLALTPRGRRGLADRPAIKPGGVLSLNEEKSAGLSQGSRP